MCALKMYILYIGKNINELKQKIDKKDKRPEKEEQKLKKTNKETKKTKFNEERKKWLRKNNETK